MKTAAGKGEAEDAVSRSDALAEAGEGDGALAVLTSAISRLPSEPWLLARRGRLFRSKEEWRRAIDDFSAALALKPDAPTTLFLRGTCWAELGQFANAIQDLDLCTRLQPKAGDAYWHLGSIHSFLGNNPRAIESYRKAFQLDPERFSGLQEELLELERQQSAQND